MRLQTIALALLIAPTFILVGCATEIPALVYETPNDFDGRALGWTRLEPAGGQTTLSAPLAEMSQNAFQAAISQVRAEFPAEPPAARPRSFRTNTLTALDVFERSLASGSRFGDFVSADGLYIFTRQSGNMMFSAVVTDRSGQLLDAMALRVDERVTVSQIIYSTCEVYRYPLIRHVELESNSRPAEMLNRWAYAYTNDGLCRQYVVDHRVSDTAPS